MLLDSWIALFSAIGICGGTVFVGFQLKAANEERKVANDQSKLDSAFKYFATNREILALGFTNPELFQILHGKKGDHPLVERHFLQLWFNHFAMVYSFRQKDVFPPDLYESFELDVGYFMEEQNAQDHWEQNCKYYPADFQAFIRRLTPVMKTKETDAHEERPSQEGTPLTKS